MDGFASDVASRATTVARSPASSEKSSTNSFGVKGSNGRGLVGRNPHHHQTESIGHGEADRRRHPGADLYWTG